MKNYLGGPQCSCGREHDIAIDDVVVGKGVLRRLPEFVAKYQAKKPFILADKNTYKAAGAEVENILRGSGIPFSTYVFQNEALEPNEEAVGSAFLHFDNSCDLIIGVGSGVINDIGKILSNVSGRRYIIVCTAPSMDGYASATSSMSRDGLKVSLNSRCADVIIGDTDILKQAPEHMLKAGLGDMLAKYVSIAEWRIGSIITGEYYCERVAQLIRSALKRCVDNAQGLLKREDAAVEAVFEGLVIGGVAMAYAGVSRPASGVEHYISHVLDMRSMEFGTTAELHGIQCATGTLLAVKLYEKLKAVIPDREKALRYARQFDVAAWHRQLRTLLGKGAESMIALEAREKKYDKDLHKARLEGILANWQEILRILEEELPSARELESLMDTIGMPKTLAQLGTDETLFPVIFCATKDIRDKYVLSRLLWDLGLLEEFVEKNGECNDV